MMKVLLSGFSIFSFVLFFLILFPTFVFWSFFGDYGKRKMWWSVKVWSWVWLFISGVRVKRSFETRPQKQNQYIFIGNHSSFIDTGLIFHCVPYQAWILAAIEFKKIPLFGFLYKQLAILIDRKSPESRQEGYQRLTQAVLDRKNIWIFPEGKMNKGHHQLTPFYNGAFRLATETGIPIFPVVIPDSRRRWTPRGLWTLSPGICRVNFLNPVSPLKKDGTTKSIEELKEECFEMMEKALIELRSTTENK